MASIVRVIFLGLLLAIARAAGTSQPSAYGLWARAAPTPDWVKVDDTIGKAGSAAADGVRRYSFPRSDLKVNVDGFHISPGLALGSWAAFKAFDNITLAMGDLVLTDDEINPVISALQEGGIEIISLHNHLISEDPKVMYMHFRGQGDAVKIAEILHAALAKTKTPVTTADSSCPAQGTPGLDTESLDAILGYGGKQDGVVYKFSVPRAEKIMDGETVIPASMGVATAINFQPARDGTAGITGDFVMTANEVPLVMRSLRDAGINITALHNHMLSESPRLFFMHFWAKGSAANLAEGLRKAIDQTNSAKPNS